MNSRRRARLILILGVFFAVIAAIGTFLVASTPQAGGPEPVPTTDVVVAAREVPARTELTAADIRVAKVNADAAPPLGIKDPEEVIGKILTQALLENEPILPTKLATDADRAWTVMPPGEELTAGSPAYRIMALTVLDANAVGGVLQPGDLVDMLYVFTFDPSRFLKTEETAEESDIISDTVAKIIVGPIQLLARQETVYTIRVEADLAERLAYVQAAGGSITFLLRAPKDERAAGTAGATFGTVYERFAFPVPEKIER